MREHAGKIYALGLRSCGSEADAEDLVQETFLRALRAWPSFRGESRATTWLYTIAARACKRMKRKRSGEPSRMPSLQDLASIDAEMAPDIPDDGESPLEESIRREADEAVDAAIESLPPAYRFPLLLKDIAGLSIAETAHALGLKESTVRTRVHRSRLLLRRALASRLPGKALPAERVNQAICLDLLAAKQAAMDRGEPFSPPGDHLCARCRSVFRTMDLAADVCQDFAADDLPDAVARALRARLANA